jgi:hypothetical protein
VNKLTPEMQQEITRCYADGSIRTEVPLAQLIKWLACCHNEVNDLRDKMVEREQLYISTAQASLVPQMQSHQCDTGDKESVVLSLSLSEAKLLLDCLRGEWIPRNHYDEWRNIFYTIVKATEGKEKEVKSDDNHNVER